MSLLEVSNLSKSFSKKQIIKNISFQIDEGEIVGFVGPNGAGKTTTLKLISNLIFPDSGEITINGYNLLKDRENALENIAAIIENPGLYKNLSGIDNLRFIQKIRRKSDSQLRSVIDYIGLKDRVNDPVKKYSLGMKQRLALGMCLLCEPKLLILDEPTNGLDPTGTMEFREIITKLAKEKKISILFSTHILSEVDKICDRIIFIKDGELVLSKNIKEISNEQSYKIYINDVKNADAALENLNYIKRKQCISNNAILITIENNKLFEALNVLNKNGITCSDIEKITSDTETDYYNIYKEGSK